MKKYFSQWLSLLTESDLWMWYIFLALVTVVCLTTGDHEARKLAFAFDAFILLMHSFSAIVYIK